MSEKEINRGKGFLKKIKDFEKSTNFSIYLGTGLYQISIGLVLTLLVSFLIGIPMILAYPYITPLLLWIFKIFGWFLIILGIITVISPIIRSKIHRYSPINKILTVVLKISTIITFVLVPIGIFLGLALSSELQEELGVERKEKSVVRIYFLILFMAGFIHLVIGILLAILLPIYIWDVFYLAYPYINYELINFLTILGWISLISGAILIVCSFWSKKFSQIESIEKDNKELKIIRILILIASLFIVFVFPIGTFFGITLLQEFYHIKPKPKQVSEEEPISKIRFLKNNQ